MNSSSSLVLNAEGQITGITGVSDAASMMTITNNPVPSANNVVFHNGIGDKILTITHDGRIEFNPSLQMDEAVKGFIQAVEQATGKASYPRRVQDLLETNTLYLKRAREAEGLLDEALDRIEPITKADDDFIIKGRAYLKAPWS